MKIIGINSRYNATMNEIYSGSCALIVDGEIIYALAEDRVSKKKDDGGFDYSLKAILNKEKLTIDDIDYFYISFYGNALIPDKKMIKYHLKKLGLEKQPEKLIVVPSHHISHAYASYFLSPFDEAIIMVADNEGSLLFPDDEKKRNIEDCYCERNSYYWARGNCITLIERDFQNPGDVGFGKAYNMFNEYIGFGNYLTVGKTMGLSSYGKNDKKLSKVDIWMMDKDGRLKSNIIETENLTADVERFLTANNIDLPKIRKGNLYELPEYQKLARYIQEQLNKWAIKKVNFLIKKVGIKNICISGGVALNGIMNEKIENALNVPVFVPPYPSDPGQALGNAIYGYIHQTGNNNNSLIKKVQFRNYTYLGFNYSEKDIMMAIKKISTTHSVKFELLDNIEEKTAELLSQDKVIGWFQGRSEYGARALGDRSILGSPKGIMIRDKINILKGRELFRPLAPSVLSEKKLEYFYEGCPLIDKYMLSISKVKKEKIKEIKGAVHIDKTSRIQEVKEKDNEKYYSLIKNFYRISGVPMVLNTSFNAAGKPIVESPYDAMLAFIQMDLDYLVCGNFLIEKQLKTK